jgi:hypothetical protein
MALRSPEPPHAVEGVYRLRRYLESRDLDVPAFCAAKALSYWLTSKLVAGTLDLEDARLGFLRSIERATGGEASVASFTGKPISARRFDAQPIGASR